MRAAVLQDYKHYPELVEMPVPDPGPGQVLVKVAGAGLCHSDLHLASGEVPMVPSFPWVLGHEITGWVEAFGPGAGAASIPLKLQHGQPVAVYGGWGCGTCALCLGGDEQLCSTMSWVGIGKPGGFAEYVLVPSVRHLVPLGDLDPVLSAPLTDAALTPYRAVRKALPRLHPGSKAIVIGAGGLGQCAVQLLRTLTPARIVAVDTAAVKRATAVELGADEAFDPSDPAARAELDAWKGAAAVIDLVGSDATLRLAGELVGTGGLITVVGLAGGVLPYGFLSVAPEATVTSSFWGNRNELAEVISLAQQGRIITRVHERDLAAVASAFEQLHQGDVDGRIVLVP